MFVDVDPRFLPLVEAWPDIAEEAASLSAARMPIRRDAKSHDAVGAEIAAHLSEGGEYGWMEGWGRGDLPERWTQFGLVHDSHVPDPARKAAPRTTALLDRTKGVYVAAFLRMAANTLLPSHRHPEMSLASMLQFHLGLNVPHDGGGAWLCVDGVFGRHLPGTAFAFDGSREHFAFNACNGPRTILYIEYLVSLPER